MLVSFAAVRGGPLENVVVIYRVAIATVIV